MKWSQLMLFGPPITWVVSGNREFPCGPHYYLTGKQKGKAMKTRARFSPHPGRYDKVCPGCGRLWLVFIMETSVVDNVLVAKWYSPDDPEVRTVNIEGDSGKFKDGSVLVDGEADELPLYYTTRPRKEREKEREEEESNV